MALEITNANLQQLLDGGKPVVIDFWAEWCGPCRMIAPFIEELAEEYKERIVVGKCNVDTENELPVKFAIRNIPTVLFFRNGELAERHVGALSKSDLKAKFEKLL